MAGLSYVRNTQYGFLRTALAGDTLDNSNGFYLGSGRSTVTLMVG